VNNPVDHRLDKAVGRPGSKPVQGLGVHGGQAGLRQRGWHGLVQRAATLWRLAWPAPWTALGLLLALPAWALGARGQWRDGVLEVSGGRLGRAAEHGWAGAFAAVTLGHVVLAVSAAQLDRLRRHERCHVRQYERWGLLFVPAYLAAGAWAWAKGQGAHAGNPFERQACAQDAADAAALTGRAPGVTR
jgi:hypothetical protein